MNNKVPFKYDTSLSPNTEYNINESNLANLPQESFPTRTSWDDYKKDFSLYTYNSDYLNYFTNSFKLMFPHLDNDNSDTFDNQINSLEKYDCVLIKNNSDDKLDRQIILIK